MFSQAVLLGLCGVMVARMATCRDVSHLDKHARGWNEVNRKAHVRPIPGSVVCCRLAGVLDHSGIFVGDGRIVHRDGDGHIRLVTPKTFLARLNGLNPARHIFVACHGADPLGGRRIVERALEALHDPIRQGYNLLKKNCHQFCEFCLTGEERRSPFCRTLEETLGHVFDMDNWRCWDFTA